jgi:hypothetical protein
VLGPQVDRLIHARVGHSVVSSAVVVVVVHHSRPCHILPGDDDDDTFVAVVLGKDKLRMRIDVDEDSTQLDAKQCELLENMANGQVQLDLVWKKKKI